MKRFSTISWLICLLACIGWQYSSAQETTLDRFLVKDQPLTFDQLKAGDTLVFNSAMYNYNKTNPQQDVPNLFLCGRYYKSSWGAAGNTLGVLTGLTSDNLFTLEEAPDQIKVNDADEEVHYKSYIIKHCDSGKYITCNLNDWSALLTDQKSEATNFSIESIVDWPAAGGGFNDYITDNTLCLVHYEADGPAFLGPAWNYGFSQYSIRASDCIVWNAFSVKYDDSAFANLKSLVSNVRNNVYIAGTDPGCYPEDKVVKFNEALIKAIDLVDIVEEDESKCLTAFTNLTNAVNDLKDAMVQLHDGYYYVMSAYPEFMNVSGVNVAMRGYDDNLLYWETFDSTNPRYVFKVTQIDSTNYEILNYGYSKYINYYKTNIQQFIEMKDECDVYSQIVYGGDGMYRIKNPNTPRYYYIDAFAYGKRTKGHIGCNSNAYEPSTYGWYLREVPSEVIEAMAPEVQQIRLTGQLSNLMDEANTTYNAAFTYDAQKDNALISDFSDNPEESQITSVYKNEDEGSIANLNDGDFLTYFKADANPDTDGYCNFIVDLRDKPVETFVFYMAKRNNQSGQNDRPTIINIYARNSLDDEWTKIERKNLPSQEAIIEMERGVALGTPYRYIRFDVEEIYSGDRSSGYPYFSLSEFQMYPATLNAELSQYSYGEGVKEACDKLMDEMTIARTAITNNNATQEQYDNLLVAINNVKPLLADSNDLVNQIIQIRDYVETYKAGDDYGQVTEEQYETMLNAIETANAFDRSKPTKNDLKQRSEALFTAFEAFKKQQKMAETNTWYYISNTENVRTGDPDNIYDTKTYGNVIYAPTSNTIDQRLKLNVDELWHGYYDRDNEMQTELTNLTTMWRLIAMSDTTYAIQNRATGTYMGLLCVDAGSGLSATPVPYKINFVGPGQFNLICQDSLNVENRPVHASGEGRVKTWAGGYETASSWTFLKVDEDLELLDFPIKKNNLSILTLPYDPGQIVEANEPEGTLFYRISGMSSDSTVELQILENSDNIQAGTPIIMLNNNYEEYDATSNETTPLYVETPKEYITEALTDNGLVGVLNGKTIKDYGYGYFDGAVLNSSSAAGVFIDGHTGYLDPNKIEKTDKPGDLTLTCKGKLITGIKSVTNSPATTKFVNVYSIDGILIKKNVNSINAKDNLKKGVYIIGKTITTVK